MTVMKAKYMTEEEKQEWRDKAHRLYKKASAIVEANPKNYDQNLVFKLMSAEQHCLDRIRTDERAKFLNNLTKNRNNE